MGRWTTGLVLLLAALFVGAQPAMAAPTTRYVAPGGSDPLNDCTSQAAPCATIQYAIGQAEAGDTVHVEGGEYAEDLTVDKALTLQGGSSTVNGGTGTAIAIEADNVSVTDFEITAEAGGLAISASGATPPKGLILRDDELLAPSVIDATEAELEEIIFQPNEAGPGPCLQLVGTEGGHKPSEEVSISKSTFGGCDPYGIELGPSVDAITIVGNQFPGSYEGVVASDASAWDVTGHVQLRENRFVNTEHLGVDNQASGTLDAEQNWWGCNAGPGAAGCDAVSEGVDASDNITLGGLIDPYSGEVGGGKLPSGNSIVLNPGERAEVAAVLNASGHGLATELPTFFWELKVHFSSSIGSLEPGSRYFEHGSASTVFTAKSTPGQGSITITYDNQTIEVPVTIRGAAVTTKPPPPPDTSPGPRLSIPGKRLLLSGPRATVALVSCALACTVKPGKATISIGGHRYRGKVTPHGRLSAESTRPIRVSLPSAVQRALKARKTGRIRVKVSVTDSEGRTATRAISVKISG